MSLACRLASTKSGDVRSPPPRVAKAPPPVLAASTTSMVISSYSILGCVHVTIPSLPLGAERFQPHLPTVPPRFSNALIGGAFGPGKRVSQHTSSTSFGEYGQGRNIGM